MNPPSATKENETTDAAKAPPLAERKVETVDHRSSAGQGNKQEERRVEVVHQPQLQPAGSKTSGGMLTQAAAAVTNTLEAAKDATADNK